MKSILGLLLLGFAGIYPGAQPPAPAGLTCELLSRPDLSVITSRTPKFGWIVCDTARGARQSAYRIIVASGEDGIRRHIGDLWDSGKVSSDQSLNIGYKGKPLQPQSHYWWTVLVWNQDNQASPFSEPQQFHTGDFDAPRAWPGDSRWVKIKGKINDQWALENRHPLAYREIAPVRMIEKSSGHYFLDFGRAAFATLKLTVSCPKDEADVEIHLGEKTVGEAEIDRAPGGSIGYVRTSLLLRRGAHTYVLALPRHRPSYPHSQTLPEHMPEVQPFRYAEIVGSPSRLAAGDVRQLALFYQFDDAASSFVSSDEELNAIWELCKYTLKATPFLGLYVDGNRERMPYEADAYIQQLGHYSVDREFAIARYTAENLFYHATWPTEWISHSILMAWADYLYTANPDLILRSYDAIKAKTLLPLAREDGLISTKTGLLTPSMMNSVHFNGTSLTDIVDWPHGTMPGQPAQDGFGPGGETDGYVFMPFNTVVNAFHYRALTLMEKIAEATNHLEDAKFYRTKAELHKKAFNRVFLDQRRGIYLDGEGTDHASLHANVFPLAFGLVPEENQPGVVAFIKTRGMACSVYGAQYLLDALYAMGEAQYALGLLTAKTDRSWWNMIRLGSTMTLEAWDARYKANLTWNHAWGSAPANIIARKLMGIEPLEPGFRKVRIFPQPGNLTNAKIQVPTIRGPINLEYLESPDAGVCINLTIPANMIAEVHLPAINPSQVYENGKPAAELRSIRFLRRELNRCVFEAESGRFQFRIVNSNEPNR